MERSIQQIWHEAQTLGIKSQNFNFWSEEELKILKENYSFKTLREIQYLIPNHSVTTIQSKANELELKSLYKIQTKWTEQEIEILKKYWFTEGCKCYKRLKNRSKQSCKLQAGRLGLTTKRDKKVLCIETNEIFVSMAEAMRWYEHTYNKKAMIGECCRGKQKTAGGYHWRYIDD